MKEKNSSFLAGFQKLVQNVTARGSSDYLTDYTPLNRTYTLKEAMDIIESGSLDAQRKLSLDFFVRDGIYRKIIIHYATILLYSGLLIPHTRGEQKLSTPGILKRYNGALTFMNRLNVRNLAVNFATKGLIYGSYYGLIYQLNKTELRYFDLPPEYCRAIYKDLLNSGRDIVEFNVTYFNTIVRKDERNEILSLYPEEVRQHYETFKRGKTYSPWCELPSEQTIYFSFFDVEVPPLISTIPACIEYDEAVEVEREKDKEEIRKIIVQHIPHLNEGTLLFEPEEALEFHRGSVAMLKGNKNLSVLTTYGDVTAISSKSSDNTTNNLIKMQENIYNEAGTSIQLFSPTGSQALKDSISNDRAFMTVFADKIADFFTYILNNLFGNGNIYFKYIFLPVSQYDKSDFITDSFKLAQSGYSFLIPAMALGIDQKDLVSLKELENDVMNLGEVLIPLASAYTQSGDEGGRPTKEPDQKQQSTIKKDESISKNGGVK